MTPESGGERPGMAEEAGAVGAAAQRYVESESGAAVFGPGALAGRAYPIYDEKERLESWAVEVAKNDQFVGAALYSPQLRSFSSAVFPKPQDYFWSPDRDGAVGKFRAVYPSAGTVNAWIVRKKTGYFWHVVGKLGREQVEQMYHTSYCK